MNGRMVWGCSVYASYSTYERSYSRISSLSRLTIKPLRNDLSVYAFKVDIRSIKKKKVGRVSYIPPRMAGSKRW